MLKYLHPRTQEQFRRLIQSMPHSLIVSSESGSEPTAIREIISHRHPAERDIIADNNWERLLTLKPLQKQSIGIDETREVERLMRLKDKGSRYVIIEDAHTLTAPAQNAILKFVEEPAPHVHIIFLTQKPLLPTIHSRSHHITSVRLSLDQFSDAFEGDRHGALLYYATDGNVNEANMINGQPEVMKQLLADVETTKAFISGSLQQRLELVLQLLKREHSDVLQFLRVMQSVIRATIDGVRRQGGSQQKLKMWYGRLESVTIAEDQLARHVQPRLILDQLMLNLQ